MRSKLLSNHLSYLNHIFYKKENKIAYYLFTHNIHHFLIGSFEVVLIFRLTGSLNLLFSYYLVLYSFLLIGQLLTPLLFRGKSVSTLYKLAIFTKGLLCLYLVIFYTSLGLYPVILIYSALRGFNEGVFWFTNHFALLDTVKENKRDTFLIGLQSINVLLPVSIPVIAGVIISLLDFKFLAKNPNLPNGYVILFLVGMVFNMISSYFGPRISKRLDFKVRYIKILRHLSKPTHQSLRNYFMFDAMEGMLVVISVELLNFFVLKNEANLGFFNSILAFLASYYFILIKRMNSKGTVKAEKFFLIGSLGEVFSRFVYVFSTNIYGLIIKSTVSTIILPLKYIFGEVIFLHKYNELMHEHHESRVHLILFREMCLAFTRIAVLLIILVILNFTKLSPTDFARFTLLAVGIFGLFDYFFVTKLVKREKSS
jgi:hypothetical protein